MTKGQAVGKQTSKNQRQPAKKQTSQKESASEQTHGVLVANALTTCRFESSLNSSFK